MRKFSSLLCVLVVVICLHGHLVSAATGVDMSSALCSRMTLDTWKCLRGKGHTFAVIEAIQGGAGLNKDLGRCYRDALTAGFERVDIYAFICPKCHGLADSAAVAVQLSDYMTTIGMNNSVTVWSDVEQCTDCWDTDLAVNGKYVAAFISALQEKGRNVGVYTNQHEAGITIGSYRLGQELWYAHYDGKQNFDDFQAFNGWSKPVAKQYQGSTAVCGTSVDYSWKP
jgi:hypothetical protein